MEGRVPDPHRIGPYLPPELSLDDGPRSLLHGIGMRPNALIFLALILQGARRRSQNS
jgi:hypothetical protein